MLYVRTETISIQIWSTKSVAGMRHVLLGHYEITSEPDRGAAPWPGVRGSEVAGNKKRHVFVFAGSDSTQQMWLQRESGELRLHYLGKHALPAAYFVVDLPDCPRTGPVAHTFTTSLCQAAPPAQAALEPMASSR